MDRRVELCDYECKWQVITRNNCSSQETMSAQNRLQSVLGQMKPFNVLYKSHQNDILNSKKNHHYYEKVATQISIAIKSFETTWPPWACRSWSLTSPGFHPMYS